MSGTGSHREYNWLRQSVQIGLESVRQGNTHFDLPCCSTALTASSSASIIMLKKKKHMLVTERFLQAFDNLFVKETKGSQPEVPGHVFPLFLLPCCIKESVAFEKLWVKWKNCWLTGSGTLAEASFSLKSFGFCSSLWRFVDGTFDLALPSCTLASCFRGLMGGSGLSSSPFVYLS